MGRFWGTIGDGLASHKYVVGISISSSIYWSAFVGKH